MYVLPANKGKGRTRIDEQTVKRICYHYLVTGNSIRYMEKLFKIPRSTIHNCITKYAHQCIPYYTNNLIKERTRSKIAEFKHTGKVVNIDYKGDISDNMDTWGNEHNIPIMKDFYHDF